MLNYSVAELRIRSYHKPPAYFRKPDGGGSLCDKIALLKTKSVPPHSFYVFLISYGNNCYRRIIFKAVILQPETRNGRLPPGRKH